MKNLKKGFTLVEMLIVVVIIGILASAILPKLQGAQGSARDTARKSDLSQLGTALVAYVNNRGEFPKGSKPAASTPWAKPASENNSNSTDNAGTKMVPASYIEKDLKDVVDLSSLPIDPNRGNAFSGVGGETIAEGQYGYKIMKKSSIDGGGFILMARTETEGGSNWIMVDKNSQATNKGTIDGTADLSTLKVCTKFQKVAAGQEDKPTEGGLCKYSDKSQLRYIYMF